jgi:hypothetical protein
MPKLRVEFCSIGSGRGRLGGQIDLAAAEPLGSVTVDVGLTPTPSGSRPLVPSGAGTVFARLLAVESAIYADIGASPDPTADPRILLLPERPVVVHATAGTAVAAVLASDLTVHGDSAALALTDRSGTVATGGTAQQACSANAIRRLLLVANPDDARTIWFSVTGTASAGPGSLQLPPGGAFVFDKLVPSGAVSIFGSSGGQPFTVTEA